MTNIITIIFIGIMIWVILAVLSFMTAIAAVRIFNKIKAALKRKGAIYV